MEIQEMIQILKKMYIDTNNSEQCLALKGAIDALCVKERVIKEYEYFSKCDLGDEKDVAQILGIVLHGDS